MGANFSIKTSVVLFYRRVFIGSIFDICTKALLGLSIVWLIYAILSWLLYCGSHVEADFDGGWAICDPWGFDIQMGVFCLDSFIDLMILLAPIPMVTSALVPQSSPISDK